MRILTLLLIFVLWTPSWAAVTIDGTPITATETGDDTSLSLSITTSGTNRLLVCGLSYQVAGGPVATFTHNGVTLVPSDQGVIDTGGFEMEVWYLKAPATGAQTVTATLTNTGSRKFLACLAFNGVDQTTPVGSGSAYSGYDDPSTASVTIVAGGMGVLFETNGDFANAGSFTVDANSTKQWDLADIDSTFASIGSTTATAGTNAQTVSNPLPHYASMIVLPINAAVAGTVPKRRPAIVLQ